MSGTVNASTPTGPLHIATNFHNNLQNPYEQFGSDIRVGAQVMYLTIPREIYTNTAKSWQNGRTELSNMVKAYNQSVVWFCRIAVAYFQRTCYDRNALVSTWEVLHEPPPCVPVPASANLKRKVVAFRLSLFAKDHHIQFGEIVEDEISDANKKSKERAQAAADERMENESEEGQPGSRSNSKKRKGGPPRSKSISDIFAQSSNYLKTVANYLDDAVYDTESAASKEPYSNSDNPLNPCNVFSLARSVEYAKNLGADPEVCNIWNYVGMDPYDEPCDDLESNKRSLKYKFPQPENVYKIQLYDLLPSDILYFFWPHVKPERSFVTEHDYERELHKRLRLGKEASIPVAEQSEEVKRKNATLNKAFDRFVNQTGRCEQRNRLEGLRKRMIERLAKAEKETPGGKKNVYEWNKRRRAAQLEGLDEFKTIYCKDGDIATSVSRGIVAWDEKHLKKFKNFCMESDPLVSDLSRLAQSLCELAVACETHQQIQTRHRLIVILWLSMMHVWLNTPFHPHTLITGPHSVSKSHALQVVAKWLIEGTVTALTDKSLKSDCVDTNDYDMIIEVFEEAAPEYFAVRTGPMNSSNPTANTKQEQQLKYKLTTGKLKVRVMTIVDGKRISMEIDIPANSITAAAGNFTADSVPAAILDRFNHVVVQEQDREYPDGRSVLSTLKQALPSGMEEMERLFIYRMQRNQSIISKIGLLSYCRILPDIDLTIPNIYFPAMLERAKTKGLQNTHSIRHYERLLFLCQSLGMFKATETVLDSPLSTLKDKEFEWRHMLEFEKHMYVDRQMCVLAAEFLQHQYENEWAAIVIQTMENKIFKDDAAKYRKQCELKPYEYSNQPYLIEKTSFTLNIHLNTIGKAVVPASGTVNAGVSNTTIQQDQLFNRFIQLIKDDVKNTVTTNDIKIVVRNMMNQTVSVKFKGEINGIPQPMQEVKIPALEIDSNGKVSLAIAILAGGKYGVLSSCLEEVICDPHATPDLLIRGTMISKNVPYEWKTVEIKPNPNAKKLVAINPAYHASALRIMSMNSTTNVEVNAFEKTIPLTESEIFDKEDRRTVTSCIEEWTGLQHCLNIGVTETEMNKFPHHNAKINRAEEVRVTEKKLGKALPKYREFIKSWQPAEMKKRLDKNHEKNVDQFTTSHHVKRMLDLIARRSTPVAVPALEMDTSFQDETNFNDNAMDAFPSNTNPVDEAEIERQIAEQVEEEKSYWADHAESDEGNNEMSLSDQPNFSQLLQELDAATPNGIVFRGMSDESDPLDKVMEESFHTGVPMSGASSTRIH